MGKSKVSIIIPCYNTADYLWRCWNSVKNQTYGIENIECIFIDDASTDEGKTFNTLLEIEKEAPENVIVIPSHENRGPGGSINQGLEYASGKYLQFLDSDDELVEDAIEKLCEIAERYDTDIIQYNHVHILGEQRRINPVSVGNRLICIDDHDKRIDFLNSTIVTYGRTNKFYNTEFVKTANVRFAEKSVYEEPLFVYPLFLYAHRVYLCEEAFYLYYLHAGSIVTSQIGPRILDHPKVQLMLLEDCMKRHELYEEYRDVIECYFLWTYYCETLLFASENMGAVVPIEYFKEMQSICRRLFPNWQENQYIQRLNNKVKKLMSTMDQVYSSQEEVNILIDGLREA